MNKINTQANNYSKITVEYTISQLFFVKYKVTPKNRMILLYLFQIISVCLRIIYTLLFITPSYYGLTIVSKQF